jgi:hypothetical protein
MGLCLKPAGKLTVVEQRAGADVERTAEHRKIH